MATMFMGSLPSGRNESWSTAVTCTKFAPYSRNRVSGRRTPAHRDPAVSPLLPRGLAPLGWTTVGQRGRHQPSLRPLAVSPLPALRGGRQAHACAQRHDLCDGNGKIGKGHAAGKRASTETSSMTLRPSSCAWATVAVAGLSHGQRAEGPPVIRDLMADRPDHHRQPPAPDVSDLGAGGDRPLALFRPGGQEFAKAMPWRGSVRSVTVQHHSVGPRPDHPTPSIPAKHTDRHARARRANGRIGAARRSPGPGPRPCADAVAGRWNHSTGTRASDVRGGGRGRAANHRAP